jgi:hypothetical protein
MAWLILQRHLVIMRVTGLVGGSGRPGRVNWQRRRHRDQWSCMAGAAQLLGQSGEQPPDLAAYQRDQVMIPWASSRRAAARTDKKAWASSAKVVRRCEEVELRT